MYCVAYLTVTFHESFVKCLRFDLSEVGLWVRKLEKIDRPTVHCGWFLTGLQRIHATDVDYDRLHSLWEHAFRFSAVRCLSLLLWFYCGSSILFILRWKLYILSTQQYISPHKSVLLFPGTKFVWSFIVDRSSIYWFLLIENDIWRQSTRYNEQKAHVKIEPMLSTFNEKRKKILRSRCDVWKWNE